MDKASKPLMVFTAGLLGFYECHCMPFGLVNAPATFQRLMETYLSDLQLYWCFIYLNDIIMFSKTPKDHLDWSRAVFQNLKEVGLKLKPSKCEFLKKTLVSLEHKILEKSTETDDSKIKVIWEWPTLQICTGYRSQLLYHLILGENASKKKTRPIVWHGESKEAFRKLKEICASTPILAYTNFSNYSN